MQIMTSTTITGRDPDTIAKGSHDPDAVVGVASIAKLFAGSFAMEIPAAHRVLVSGSRDGTLAFNSCTSSHTLSTHYLRTPI